MLYCEVLDTCVIISSPLAVENIRLHLTVEEAECNGADGVK
jgi:hypothetical protein